MAKLILLFVVVLAIPLIVLGGYYANMVRNSQQSELIKNNIFFVRQVKFNIDKKAEVCQRAAEIVIRNKKFIEYIAVNDIANVDDEEIVAFRNDMLNSINNIKFSNLDIYEIRFFAHRIPFEIWPILYDESRIIKSNWYEEMGKDVTRSYWHVNNIYETYKTVNPQMYEVVSLYKEVRYPSSQHLGTLEVCMLTSDFFEEMYDKNLDKENSCLIVIDKQNQLLFNENGSFFKKRGFEDLDLLMQTLTNNTEEEEGYFSFILNKESMFCAYMSIPSIGSHIYQIVSTENLIEEANKVKRFVSLGVIGIVTVLSLITYAILRMLLNKLNIIVGTMRKVQEGDLHVDIPVYGVDEIGELAYHYRKMLAKINELISIVVRKQTAEKDAQIRALQSQINAHFIYNVLESIRMMAEIKGEDEISDIIASLGRLLRYSMKWNKQYVLLEEEIEYVKDYIILMNARYYSKIRLIIDVEDRLMKAEVFKMLLQPVVENAVLHGIQSKGGDGVISIKAAVVEDDMLIITVQDDGIGMNKEKLDKLKETIEFNQGENVSYKRENGLGLKNINERIRLFYGNKYGLDICSEENKYTKVTLKLKYRREMGW